MGRPGCGYEILLSFLANPKQAPDTSCLARLAPVTFSGIDHVSLYLFGTSIMWSGPPTPR